MPLRKRPSPASPAVRARSLPMSARVNTGEIAPTLVSQTSDGRGGTAGPMQLVPPAPDEAQQRVWNVQPVSSLIEPNTLTAKPAKVAEALTSVGPQRRSDRGDLVQAAVCASGEVTHTLKADGFDGSEDGTGRGMPITPTSRTAVRRLTPTECERLQGFPDGWTLVPELPKRGRRASA